MDYELNIFGQTVRLQIGYVRTGDREWRDRVIRGRKEARDLERFGFPGNAELSREFAQRHAERFMKSLRDHIN